MLFLLHPLILPSCTFLASILSKMLHLSHFGMFAFKEKTRGHRQKCCTCHGTKRPTRSVLTPPCLATILSQMPRLSRFGMFAFGFGPRVLKRGHDIARSVSALGARSVSTPSPPRTQLEAGHRNRPSRMTRGIPMPQVAWFREPPTGAARAP